MLVERQINSVLFNIDRSSEQNPFTKPFARGALNGRPSISIRVQSLPHGLRAISSPRSHLESRPWIRTLGDKNAKKIPSPR